MAKVKTGCSARVRATGLQIQTRQDQYRAFNRPLGSVKTLGIALLLVRLMASLYSAAAFSALDHTERSVLYLFFQLKHFNKSKRFAALQACLAPINFQGGLARCVPSQTWHPYRCGRLLQHCSMTLHCLVRCTLLPYLMVGRSFGSALPSTCPLSRLGHPVFGRRHCWDHYPIAVLLIRPNI